MLVHSAADFEDFPEPHPDMPAVMESDLKAVIRHLVENRWPFRLHAIYEEPITHTLNVYEEVNREVPFEGRLAALGIAGTMLTATVFLIQRGEPFINPAGHSWENSVFYLTAGICLALSGAGPRSLDAWFFGRRNNIVAVDANQVARSATSG